MSEIILDASAVLALLQQEKGHDVVEKLLLDGECRISTVNLSEVITKLVDKGASLVDACAAVQLPNLRVEVFDTRLAQIAASLRAATRSLGLSLGDRACLALARVAGNAHVYTADAAWRGIVLPGVTVSVIR